VNPRSKRLLFIAIAAIVPATLFLLIAEGILRISGFGYAATPLIRAKTGTETVWVGNPDFTRLFFQASLKRLPAPIRTPVDKDDNARRYMIVGGSAAAGDPDPDFSIARNLEWILSQAQPAMDWQVINLAYTACNSHVAAEVVSQSEPYDLDGIIVLVGNNEVIGPFGPGTTLTKSAPAKWWRNLAIALRKTRLGQLGQLLQQKAGNRADAPEAWRGMQHFLKHRIPFDDPRLDQVYTNFRDNLDNMQREARHQDIPILLSNVPVNLLDQPPFQDDLSTLPEDLSAATLEYLQSGQSPLPLEYILPAAEAHPRSAYLAYMAGRMLFEAGKPAAADPLLRRARDLDLLRFRADSMLNAIIADEWQRADTNWLALDAEAPLIVDNPRHVLGFPHFYEHVHFSFRANFVIACEMAKVLLAHENLDTSKIDTLDWTQAAAALAYTPYEAWIILEEIQRRFSQPPFTDIPGYARLTAWMDTLRETLLQRISLAEEKAQMSELYSAAIRARPADDRIKLNYANFLEAFGQTDAAFAILEDIHPRHPTDSEMAITRFNLCVKLGKEAQAQEALRQIERIFPEHPSLEKFRKDMDALKTAGK
jgi:Flp pilus assembly protein TadD